MPQHTKRNSGGMCVRLVNTVQLWTRDHQRTKKPRECKARQGIQRTSVWPKNTANAEEKNLGSTHLRLLSLRGSCARPRCSPISLIPTFDGSKKRTSRTVGLEPFPNLKKEKIPPFTVCGGKD